MPGLPRFSFPEQEEMLLSGLNLHAVFPPIPAVILPLLPSNSEVHYNVDIPEISIVGTTRSYSTSHISLTSTRITVSWDILIIPTAPSITYPHRPGSCTLVAQTPKLWTSFSGGAVKLGEHRELNSNHFHFYFLLIFFSFSFPSAFPFAFPVHFHFRFPLNLNAHCHWQCRVHFRHFN
jgi:hypothetical protein